MLLLKLHVSVCPGDEGHPPVVPLPRPPAPHLVPPLALPPAHAVPDVDAGGGMGGDPGPDRGRGGVPDLIPGVEEGSDPGGDVTGHDHGPTTGTEREKGIETGTGTGTGDDIQHADERGWSPQCLKCFTNVFQQFLMYNTYSNNLRSLFIFCQVTFQLTPGGKFEARGSEQWRPPAGRQRQPQSLSVSQSH